MLRIAARLNTVAVPRLEAFQNPLATRVWFTTRILFAETGSSVNASASSTGRHALAVLAASSLFQAAVPLGFIFLEQWFAGRGGV